MIYGKDVYKIKDKRVVLLQSGGLDSCYLACLLDMYGFEIHHVFIDYGQNASSQELKSARRIAEKYKGSGGKFHVVNLVMPWLKDATLLNGGEVTTYDVDYTLGAVKVGTYVPMRNIMFLSMASSLAEHLKIQYIATGLDGSEDFFRRPLGGTTDKHPTFVKKLEKALTESSVLKHVDKKKIELITPVMGNRKDETILLGNMINCDFSLSWTCYNNTEEPCGKCCACVDRINHFELLGLKDPVKYQNNIK